MSTIKIIKAKYLHDYILRLTFNNGEIRDCDFFPLAQKGICVKLQDIDFFRSFTIDPFTVDWNNEIGFAPEFLYENSVPPSYFENEGDGQGTLAADDSTVKYYSK